MEPPKDSKWLHNYNAPSRKSREKPKAVYTMDGIDATLLAKMPDTLTDTGRAAFLSAAQAPWLSAVHLPLVTAYAELVERLATASQGLDAAMRDPDFATPGTEAHRTGKLYLRLTTRTERQLATLAKTLALTPLARSRLGIALID